MPISAALGSSALLPAGVGMRNLIINGDMRINQRNATVMSSGYTVDRWYQFKYGGGAVSTTQDTASVPANFKYALKTQCTFGLSAGTAAATYYEQRIEGNNVIHLGFGTSSAKSLILSFWVKSSLTGKHSVAFGNSAETRKYITTYTVNAANTWEYKSVTITGDTGGTWLTDTGIGLRVYFVMVSGTTDQQTSTVDQWFTDSGALKIAATGSVDLMATTGNTFSLTGVQLEQNYQPTPFEQRPIGVELSLCQRYYYRLGNTAVTGAYLTPTNNFVYSANSIEGCLQHPVPMRTHAVSFASSSVYAYNVVQGNWNGVPRAASSSYNSTTHARIVTDRSGGTDWSAYFSGTSQMAFALIANGTSGYIEVSAEL